MFAGDEEGPPLVDVTEKVSGTKIAVFNPEITRLHRLQKAPNSERSCAWPFSQGKTSVTKPWAGS